ncbi:MAG: hypothetical protein IKO57_12155 [Treponema sp.]|nr:hypothetical protein [Treponema sp.]
MAVGLSGSSGVPYGISHINKLGGRAMNGKIAMIIVIIAVLLVLGYPVW